MRGIRVRFECGHEAVICTSFYRLSQARVAGILGHAVRSPEWCWDCDPSREQMIAEYLGTCANDSERASE